MKTKALIKKIVIRAIIFVYRFAPIHCGINDKSRSKKIIVSLTSYPARFKLLHITIRSLLTQTVKPDAVILYLGEDSKNELLPQQLLSLTKKGLSIEFREGNLRSHKKYYYALQEYPDDIIILVDDDMIYEPKMVERLMKSYEKYPQAVSAMRVHRMAKNPDGGISDYNHWHYEFKESIRPGLDIFSTTGFGTLLPPGCMDNKVLDAGLFMRACYAADDIWLKFMQLLRNTPTVYVPSTRYIYLPDTQASSLSATNVDNNQNDVFIKNMERETGVNLGEFCSLIYTPESTYLRLEK